MKTNKFKNYLKIGIAIIFSFLLSNCENETIIDNQENQTDLEFTKEKDPLIIKAQSWFEQNQKQNNFIILDYAKPLNWDLAFINHSNGSYAIEVPIEMQDQVAVSLSKTKNVTSFNRLLILPTEDLNSPFRSYIANFHDSSNNIKKFNSHLSNINYFHVHPSFKGQITLMDSMNQTIEIKQFPFSNENSVNLYAKLEMKAGCVYIGWWYEDGTFEPIMEVGCYGEGTGGGGGANDTGNDQPNQTLNMVEVMEAITRMRKTQPLMMMKFLLR